MKPQRRSVLQEPKSADDTKVVKIARRRARGKMWVECIFVV
jgi:hypothetical protein